MRALFATAAWGNAYVDRFLDYSLRTQLSDGNLGAFDPRSLFLIITDRASTERVASSPAFHQLSRMVGTELVPLESISGSHTRHKYARLTACQNYILARSESFDAVFFGYSDALWADGSYRAALRRLDEGYDAIFSFGYPVVSAPFTAAIDEAKAKSTTKAAAVAPRTLAHLVHEHLHPMARANNWNNECMSDCPSYVTWDVAGQGMLLRAFHLHPVAVRVRRDFGGFFLPFRSTLDEEFVARLYRSDPRVYVCPTSDEIGVCSLADLTTATHRRWPPRRVSGGALAEFAEAHAGLMHRELFMHSIRLVVADVCEDRWEQAEREAAKLADNVRRRLAIPDSVLALDAPAAYAARWQRQEAFRHMSPWTVAAQREAARSAAVAVTRPSLLRYVAWTGFRALHALYITRALRLAVLPLFNPRQWRWCYEVLHDLGVSAPLILVSRRIRAFEVLAGFWRWLWSWLRVHA